MKRNMLMLAAYFMALLLMSVPFSMIEAKSPAPAAGQVSALAR